MAFREWMQDLAQDVRYAARGLIHRPGFTIVAVVTLANGIGANTAIFGAVNALLLRPLPFREPERLMAISLTGPGGSGAPGMESAPWSFPKFVLYRELQQSFSEIWNNAQFQRNRALALHRTPPNAICASCDAFCKSFFAPRTDARYVRLEPVAVPSAAPTLR